MIMWVLRYGVGSNKPLVTLDRYSVSPILQFCTDPEPEPRQNPGCSYIPTMKVRWV